MKRRLLLGTLGLLLILPLSDAAFRRLVRELSRGNGGYPHGSIGEAWAAPREPQAEAALETRKLRVESFRKIEMNWSTVSAKFQCVSDFCLPLNTKLNNDLPILSVTNVGTGGGVQGFSTHGEGIHGESSTGYGIVGRSESSHGGFFSSTNDHLDLALGGAVGRMNSDPGLENSNLVLSRNNDGEIRLDNDGGEEGVFRVVDSGGKAMVKVDEQGILAVTARTITPVLEITGGSDFAETFNVTATAGPGRGASSGERVVPGMVVSIDPGRPGNLKVSTEPYDRKVAGVISGAGGVAPGVFLGQSVAPNRARYPVALSGRAYCLADTSHGAINVGDLLTTSETPGHAMRVADYTQAHGSVLGKAMTPLARGKGLVLVLVNLH